MTNFQVTDAEALAVAIRFIDSVGERVTSVVPVNNYFVLRCTGDVEISNKHDLRPFVAGLDRRRCYWASIATVQDSACEFLDVFQAAKACGLLE